MKSHVLSSFVSFFLLYNQNLQAAAHEREWSRYDGYQSNSHAEDRVKQSSDAERRFMLPKSTRWVEDGIIKKKTAVVRDLREISGPHVHR